MFSIDSGYDTFMPWLTNAILALGFVVILMRVGLVAVILGRFVSSLILANPVTSDLSVWYSAASNFTVMLVVMLLIYGFYLSLAGRPIIASRLLDD